MAHKVLTVRDTDSHKNFGIEFPNGKILSVGFGEGHYCGDESAEVCVIDVDGKPITHKYFGLSKEYLVEGYVGLGKLIELINVLNKEGKE